MRFGKELVNDVNNFTCHGVQVFLPSSFLRHMTKLEVDDF